MIRAIFDSKFNEYQLYDDPAQYTRFPEFVFSWLNNFKFDLYSKKVISLTYDKYYYDKNGTI